MHHELWISPNSTDPLVGNDPYAIPKENDPDVGIFRIFIVKQHNVELETDNEIGKISRLDILQLTRRLESEKLKTGWLIDGFHRSRISIETKNYKSKLAIFQKMLRNCWFDAATVSVSLWVRSDCNRRNGSMFPITYWQKKWAFESFADLPQNLFNYFS